MKEEFEIKLKKIKVDAPKYNIFVYFSADVYVNGKKSFFAMCNNLRMNTDIKPIGNPKYKFKEIDKYFKNLPKLKNKYKQSFESKIYDLFYTWFEEKERKKYYKFTIDHVVCQNGEQMLCYFWKDENNRKIPIEELLLNPNLNDLVFDKVAEIKDNSYTILNTNIPNI
jgi:hypothetical protein